MLDWLVKRLTPSKRTTPRWADLARTLQSYWETHFDPHFNSLYGLLSVYTADEDGQRRMVGELGGYFEPDLAEKNRAISIAMRKFELMMKDTDYPIRMAIQRLGVDGADASFSALVLPDVAGSGRTGRLRARMQENSQSWQLEVDSVVGTHSADVFLEDRQGSGAVAQLQVRTAGLDENGFDIWDVVLTETEAAASGDIWLKSADGNKYVVKLEAEVYGTDDDGNNMWRVYLGQGRYSSFEGVEWVPLYALESDGPYGTKFYHAYTGIPDGAWLTSRGMLLVDLAYVDNQEILAKIEAMVLKVKPLHIVYDGQYFKDYNISYDFELITHDGKNIAINDDSIIIT